MADGNIYKRKIHPGSSKINSKKNLRNPGFNLSLVMIISLKKDKKLWVTTEGEGTNTMELIPIANNKFYASGLLSPISFTRNASGMVTALVDYDLDPATYLKVQHKEAPH